MTTTPFWSQEKFYAYLACMVTYGLLSLCSVVVLVRSCVYGRTILKRFSIGNLSSDSFVLQNHQREQQNLQRNNSDEEVFYSNSYNDDAGTTVATVPVFSRTATSSTFNDSRTELQQQQQQESYENCDESFCDETRDDDDDNDDDDEQFFDVQSRHHSTVATGATTTMEGDGGHDEESKPILLSLSKNRSYDNVRRHRSHSSHSSQKSSQSFHSFQSSTNQSVHTNTNNTNNYNNYQLNNNNNNNKSKANNNNTISYGNKQEQEQEGECNITYYDNNNNNNNNTTYYHNDNHLHPISTTTIATTTTPNVPNVSYQVSSSFTDMKLIALLILIASMVRFTQFILQSFVQHLQMFRSIEIALSTFPVAIFITIELLLVFFWAEIVHKRRNDEQLRLLFKVINIVMYLLLCLCDALLIYQFVMEENNNNDNPHTDDDDDTNHYHVDGDDNVSGRNRNSGKRGMMRMMMRMMKSAAPSFFSLSKRNGHRTTNGNGNGGGSGVSVGVGSVVGHYTIFEILCVAYLSTLFILTALSIVVYGTILAKRYHRMQARSQLVRKTLWSTVLVTAISSMCLLSRAIVLTTQIFVNNMENRWFTIVSYYLLGEIVPLSLLIYLLHTITRQQRSMVTRLNQHTREMSRKISDPMFGVVASSGATGATATIGGTVASAAHYSGQMVSAASAAAATILPAIAPQSSDGSIPQYDDSESLTNSVAFVEQDHHSSNGTTTTADPYLLSNRFSQSHYHSFSSMPANDPSHNNHRLVTPPPVPPPPPFLALFNRPTRSNSNYSPCYPSMLRYSPSKHQISVAYDYSMGERATKERDYRKEEKEGWDGSNSTIPTSDSQFTDDTYSECEEEDGET